MKNLRLALAAVVIATSASAATAASINLTWDSNPFNPGSPIDLIHFVVPGNSGSTYPDRYHGEASGLVGLLPTDLVDGGLIEPASIFTYCYELTQYFSPGQTVAYTVNFSGVHTATLDFLGAVNSVLGGGNYAWIHPSTVTIAAAVQIGIWETLYDGSTFDLGSGNLVLTGMDAATSSQLAAFTTAMSTAPSLGAGFAATLESNTAQNQITAFRHTSQQVPEPGSAALVGLGLLALGAFAQRRRA